MNWSDEHYVKLYTRDSLTWRSWHWEARTVFLHLIRKVDHSGFIETGTMSIVDALVLQLELPKAVVESGMAALIGCGTCEAVDGAVLLTKFNEAQEARKTDAQKKRDERSRNIAKRRERMSPAVTESHPVSPGVTGSHPNGPSSPAQPSPARPQPEKLAGKKPPADPRLAPLTDWLVDVYAQERGGKYKHGGAKDALALKALLPIATDAEISDRWRLGLRATGWASCSTFAQLGSKWNDLTAPAKASGPVDAGTQAHTQTGYFE